MTSFSSKHSPLENILIGNILREYPQMSKIMERYFGQDCLKKPGFKIKTLEMACILFGVDQDRLVRDIREVQYLGANKNK
ncbi:MAG: hypothetical protein A2026_00095 [Deltaproteobacteria bacterium RBG_19FT_COMBO_46_12]|nr:MAG: hypothetical protein A2026_00095 [Deltaproteobacteria bacterium RBG_19FT_COMBO_46_12]